MNPQIFSFFIVLAIIWFLLYWILGGVFFAVMTIMRLGRIRAVRFSCLFTLLALMVGVGASYFGLSRAQEVVSACLMSATNKAEIVASIFGCGFANIFSAFLLGAAVLTVGGFIIMSISKSKSKPWIVLEDLNDEGEAPVASQQEVTDDPIHISKFF
jgi:hypothetical protein